MPDIYEYEKEEDWMGACVPMMTHEGKDNEQATAACLAMWRDKDQAAKYRLLGGSVKAVGDWELDVLAIPFNIKDSDQQWFDENTDVMDDTFQTPLVAYQHGIKQGAKEYQEKPIRLGNVIPGSLKKLSDGWHIRVVLDKAIKQARDIWEAAKRGLVAVSSGSISHLARLDVGGKSIMYEKNRPGRISVWALAEVSLWEMGNGNVKPANSMAYAMPLGAMKAIYRDTGMVFPEIKSYGVLPEAKKAVKQSKIERTNKETEKLLKYFKE